MSNEFVRSLRRLFEQGKILDSKVNSLLEKNKITEEDASYILAEIPETLDYEQAYKILIGEVK